jgi:hypothetical protein
MPSPYTNRHVSQLESVKSKACIAKWFEEKLSGATNRRLTLFGLFAHLFKELRIGSPIVDGESRTLFAVRRIH